MENKFVDKNRCDARSDRINVKFDIIQGDLNQLYEKVDKLERVTDRIEATKVLIWVAFVVIMVAIVALGAKAFL